MGETVDVHVRQSDFFAWNMERDPLLRSTIVAVSFFDGVPDWDVLVERIERATRLTPTFRQRLVGSPFRLAPPRFEVDPDFDLAWHLRRLSAPAPGDVRTVLDFARNAGMAAFDPARPLWEFTLLDGLEGGRSALVLKVHHSLTDGIGGIQLAQHVVDLEREPSDLGPLPDVPTSSELPFGPLGRLLEAIGYDVALVGRAALERLVSLPGDVIGAVRDPLGSAAGAVSTAGSIFRFVRPVTETLSPVMRDRRLQWHYDMLEVPLPGLKAAARTVGGTLNDAFLAGVTGGLRRYHESHAAEVDALRLTMPISIREDGDAEGGNRVTLVRFAVPVGIEDPAERMREIHRICGEQRHEPAIPYSNVIAGVLNLLPNQVVGGMLKHVDFLASNVPGLPVPVYLGGAEVDGFFAFGPTLGSSANITLMSYRDTCCIGVNTDAGAVTDQDLFVDCLVEGFEEVLALGDAEHAPCRILTRG